MTSVKATKPSMLRASWVAVVLATGVGLLSLSALLFVQHNTDQRERALLQSATIQAAALSSSTLSTTLSPLDSLAATVTNTGGSPEAFTIQARSLVHSPLSVVLVKAYLTHYVAFAAIGSAYQTGQGLSGSAAITAHHAHATVTPGPVLSAGDMSAAGFAVGGPLVPEGSAIYLQLNVDPFVAGALTLGPPPTDLQVALYGSTSPGRGNLIAATSTQLPLPGTSVSEPVPVGDGTWTLAAAARRPMAGSIALEAAFMVLILGLVLAVSLGVLVEGFVRRRVSTANDVGSTAFQPAPQPVP